MHHLMNNLRLFLSLLALLVLTGCLGLKAKPDPSRYYVLGGGAGAGGRTEINCAKMVIVGPVTLAGHLDNPRIARRIGEHEIDYSDWHFWGAPLSRAVPRRLISSLSGAMPDTCVFSYREASPDQNSIRLELSIEQFELTDSSTAVVAASWRITSGAEKKRRQGRAQVIRPYQTGQDEFGSGVQALTVALDDLAKKIAADLP